MRADLVELLTPISDHYATFAQGVEHLPSQAHPAELVVEALLHSFGARRLRLRSISLRST